MRAFKLSHTWIAGVLLTSCAGGSNGDLYGSTSNLVEAESNEVYVAELELLDMEVLVENEQDLAVEVYAFDREGRTEVVLGELAAGERTTWHLPVGATEGPVYLIARPLEGEPDGREFQVSEPFTLVAGEYGRWALLDRVEPGLPPAVIQVVSCPAEFGC